MKEVWHRHLGTQNLQKLAKDNLVDGLDYDALKEIGLCESCTEGKHHRCRFPTSGGTRANEPPGLVHSDVCGKMYSKSLSGAEYLTFIDDHTWYVWVYVLPAAQGPGLQSIFGMESASREIDRETTESCTHGQWR